MDEKPLWPYRGVRPEDRPRLEIEDFGWRDWILAGLVAVPLVVIAVLLFIGVLLWVAGLWVKDRIQNLCGKKTSSN